MIFPTPPLQERPAHPHAIIYSGLVGIAGLRVELQLCKSVCSPHSSHIQEQGPSAGGRDRNSMKRRDDIRNVAIIAHVDHGKTTLVDAMLRQSGRFRASQLQGGRILDSNDFERGARDHDPGQEHRHPVWRDQDQPDRHTGPRGFRRRGGADAPDGRRGVRAGRCLRRADAADQVCAPQGVRLPHPADRGDQQGGSARRPANEVLNEVFDTFVELGASEEQLDFSYIFVSGKAGFASHDPAASAGNVGPLFDLIVAKVPGPVVEPDGPFSVLCTTLDFSEYVGRIAIGRIVSGKVRHGQKAAPSEGERGVRARVDRQRAPVRQARPSRGR